MFTHSIFETPDMDEQGQILAEVAKLVDTGRILTTATERLAPVDAKNLKAAHALSESGTARGTIVDAAETTIPPSQRLQALEAINPRPERTPARRPPDDVSSLASRADPNHEREHGPNPAP